MTFDDKHKQYSRLEAMKVAKAPGDFGTKWAPFQSGKLLAFLAGSSSNLSSDKAVDLRGIPVYH
jgi:hypothetical protein